MGLRLTFLTAVPPAVRLVTDLVKALGDGHITTEERETLLADLANLIAVIQAL